MSLGPKSNYIPVVYAGTKKKKYNKKSNKKTNGPSMEQKFKEKTIAKVKNMIAASKRDKEKIK